MLNKILGGLWPVLSVIFFVWMNSEGILNLGGGEKDILFAVPLFIFSILYLCVYLICLRMKFVVIKAIIISSVCAFVVLMIISVIFAGVMGLKG